MPSSMPTSDDLQARFMDLYFPIYLLFISLSYLPSTFIRNPLLIFRPRSFQSAWFANLWAQIGPQMALSPEQIPYISSLASRAKGVVLELGPGNGDQMRHFIQVVQDGNVDRIVGAEPNPSLHTRLKHNAKGVGLDPDKGRYVVLQAGAQPASLIPALHKAGFYPSGGGGEGVFDTVICIKSMCSVPQRQMEETCNLIYGLLKPGGEFLFFEHVKNETDWITMLYAWLLNCLWPTAMGGCQLDGRVDRVVKQMGTGKGRWDSVDVRDTREFRGWNVFRYAIGICRK